MAAAEQSKAKKNEKKETESRMAWQLGARLVTLQLEYVDMLKHMASYEV